MKLGTVIGVAFFGIAALGGLTSMIDGIAEKQAAERERMAQAKAAHEAAMQEQQRAVSQAKAEFLKPSITDIKSSSGASAGESVRKPGSLKQLRQTLRSSSYSDLVVNVRSTTKDGIATIIVDSSQWKSQTSFEKQSAAQYMHASWKNSGGSYATQTKISTGAGTVVASVTRSPSSPMDNVQLND